MLKFFFKNFIWHFKNLRFFNNFLYYYYYYIITFILRLFTKKFKSSDSWCEKHISKKNIIKKKFLNNRSFKKIKIKKIKKSAANIDLLYSIIYNNKNIKKILETGVSYGYSSYAILESIKYRKKSFLYSIDMPYVEKINFEYVGSVVPKNLRKKWKLFRCPDRNGIAKISQMGMKFDLIHYDSDKTFYGRYVSYFKIYDLLKKGGIFISDDVGDNHAFKHFVNKKKVKFYILKANNKYQGLFIK